MTLCLHCIVVVVVVASSIPNPNPDPNYLLWQQKLCNLQQLKNRRFYVQQPTFLFPLETPLRITRKLLKIDRYMLRGVWQALNCLSICTIFIRATYCVIIAGASPGETKMWAVVRENGDFVTVVNYTIL